MKYKYQNCKNILQEYKFQEKLMGLLRKNGQK